MSLRQAAAALRLAVPRIAAQAARSEATTATTTTARTLKTSAAPRRAEGYHYDYEHGPNAMDFQNWPGRKRKVATWIVGIIVTGIAVPSGAVIYQQSKLKA